MISTIAEVVGVIGALLILLAYFLLQTRKLHAEKIGYPIINLFGAIFVAVLPEMISLSKDYIPDIIAEQAGLEAAVYGLILLLFIRFEPLGLYGRWLKIKFYFEHFPYYKKDTFKRVRKFYRREMQ